MNYTKNTILFCLLAYSLPALAMEGQQERNQNIEGSFAALDLGNDSSDTTSAKKPAQQRPVIYFGTIQPGKSLRDKLAKLTQEKRTHLDN